MKVIKSCLNETNLIKVNFINSKECFKNLNFTILNFNN
jgi:hypothetical protein